MHIGVHTGDAVAEGDDFIGHTVIVASRLADAAGSGEILVSSLSEQLVQGSGEFIFDGHRETAAERHGAGAALRDPLLGREVNDVELWERVGLYDPVDPSVRRAPGAPRVPDRTRRHHRADGRSAQHRDAARPGGDLVTQGSTEIATVADIAENSGIALDRVLRALLAAGIPAQPDTELPAELVGLMAAFEQGAGAPGRRGDACLHPGPRSLRHEHRGGRDRTVLRGARAGDGTRGTRRARPGPPLRGGDDRVHGGARRLGAHGRWTPSSERSAGPSWPGAGLAPFGPADDAAGPTEVVALGFVDLVGSTAWAQSVNLRDQSLALTRFESAAWSSAVLAGGRVVKTIGDEVFFAAPTADAACRIGTEVCRAAADDPVLPPARGAVGVGPAIPREGDYFGPLVNLLARLVKVGAPGEVVVTEAVAAELDPQGWSVHPLEPADLRGIEGPVRRSWWSRRTTDA